MKHIGCGYLRVAVTMKNWKAVVANLVGMIRASKIDFDTIAFRGTSGALIAPAVAAKLRKNILMVRKQGDGSHSGCPLEGNGDIERYIIVDDFIATGATVEKILAAVKDEPNTHSAVCVGFFGYAGTGWNPNRSWTYTDSGYTAHTISFPVRVFFLSETTAELSEFGGRKANEWRARQKGESVVNHWKRLASTGFDGQESIACQPEIV
jgi:hypothetical protein